jgi:hypothetical protein
MRKVYAESRDDEAHRVLMYSVASDEDWWVIRETLTLRRLKDDRRYVDRFGGYWYVQEFR